MKTGMDIHCAHELSLIIKSKNGRRPKHAGKKQKLTYPVLFPGGKKPETNGAVGLKMDKGIASVRERETRRWLETN
jgi:hypothetical protein